MAIFEPFYYQEESVKAFFRFIGNRPNRGKNPLIVLPTGCHIAGQLIRMANGTTKKVENIKVGDFLQGPDSHPREVLQLCRGYGNMYKITPNKGTPFIINEDHILSLKKTNTRDYSNLPYIYNVTLKEYMRWSQGKKHAYKLYRSEEISYHLSKEKQFIIPPYILGLLLGDGSFAQNHVEFCSVDNILLSKFATWIKNNNYSFSFKQVNSITILRLKNAPEILSYLRKLNLLNSAKEKVKDKYIPDEYMTSSISDRYELLAGLIDTDGCLSQNTYDIIFKSKKLAQQTIEIARSLGLAAYLKTVQKTCQTKVVNTYYRFIISGHINKIPVQLKRKQATARKQIKNVLNVGFNVSYIGKNYYYGFKIDRDNLYLLDDFTVTHNSGKSHVLALICKRTLEKWPNLKITILSHTKDILEQDFEKLQAYLENSNIVGLYSAGLKRRENKQITVAGIQTVYNLKEAFKDTNLVIVDEAHRIPPTGEGRYRTFFENNKPQFILGLTATPYRLGTGMLTDEGHIFDRIIYEAPIRKLIDEGFLSKLKSKETKEQMSIEGVKVVAGDYSAKSLADKLDRTNISDRICNELAKYKDKRKHWLIFAIDIDHADHIAEILNKHGITAAAVHSQLPSSINNMLMKMYKDGRIQALVNVEKYTTGFDFPEIDLIAMLRPTKSPVLHVQTIGRGLRVVYNTNAVTNFNIHSSEHRHRAIAASDKQDCLVLDFAGNISRLGPIDDIEIQKKSKGKGGGLAPTKTCPECEEIVPLSIMECPDCGYKWEKIEQLMIEASCESVLKQHKPNRTFNVKTVYYHKHNKINKLPSLKVTYVCDGIKTFYEWIHFETAHLRGQAEHWWQFRSGTNPPFNTDEAISRIDELAEPKQIEVDLNGRFPAIKRYHFKFDPRLNNIRKRLSASNNVSTTEGIPHGLNS